MFRRPTEVSSGSSSESDKSDNREDGNSVQDVSRDSHHSSEIAFGEADLATTETLSSDGNFSVADNAEFAIADVERHRNMMLASLLEDYYKTRAADLANAANPGASFTRQSPEVQHVASRMFEQASQSLVSSGVLTASTANTNSGGLREQYLAGFDSLGLQDAIDGDMRGSSSRRQLAEGPHATASDAVSLVGESALSLRHGRSLAQSVDKSRVVRSTLEASMHSLDLGSPYTGLQLLTMPPHPRSHYESSFQEVKLLGRGGFGQVYHSLNLLDQKEYAVKEIPLNPRLSQKYRERGLSELHHNLREVQALAKFEHCNIVRYHATWIEEPRIVLRNDATTHLQPIPSRRLITDKPATSAQHDVQKQFDISKPAQEYKDDSLFERSKQDAAHGERPHQDHSPLGQTLDHEVSSSLNASEIFTDGNAQPQPSNDKHLGDFVLHIQMSLYPMTLAQYIAPPRADETSPPSSPIKRHCFHLLPALRILLGILCGLQYIHMKGMVHRDIKPSNIFISSLDHITSAPQSEGFYDAGSCLACIDSDNHYVNPRIGDFGLVAELARGSEEAETLSSDREIGTQFYRPPVRKNKKGKRMKQITDEKLDVYAVGVIVVELLWRCSTSSERMFVLKGLQEGRLPAIAKKVDEECNFRTTPIPQAGFGNAVEECIRGMIHEDPELRWSCDKVRTYVEDVIRRASLLLVERGRLKSIETQDSMPD